MGPILEAIDDGHIGTISDRAPNQGDLVCDIDRELWPCPVMVAARLAQRDYADRLNNRPTSTAWPVAVAAR
jgi:hypothetical protein